MIRLHKLEEKKIKAIERYFKRMQYTIEWSMERLIKPFKTTSFHRTLTEYFDALYKSRLVFLRLVEPRPTREMLQKYPGLLNALNIPQSIVVESMKTKSNSSD